MRPHIIAHSAVIKLYWICLVPQSYSTAHLHVTSGPGFLHVLVLQVVLEALRAGGTPLLEREAVERAHEAALLQVAHL